MVKLISRKCWVPSQTPLPLDLTTFNVKKTNHSEQYKVNNQLKFVCVDTVLHYTAVKSTRSSFYSKI